MSHPQFPPSVYELGVPLFGMQFLSKLSVELHAARGSTRPACLDEFCQSFDVFRFDRI